MLPNRMAAPRLDLPLVGGGRLAPARGWRLLVFYRGEHCGQCKTHLVHLGEMQAAFAERDADLVAITMEDADGAARAAAAWGHGLPVAYGLSRDAAEAYGLHISRAKDDSEPAAFTEPGIFLLRPDGTVQASWVQSAPWGRPPAAALLHTVTYVQEHGYPARGEETTDAVTAVTSA